MQYSLPRDTACDATCDATCDTTCKATRDDTRGDTTGVRYDGASYLMCGMKAKRDKYIHMVPVT